MTRTEGFILWILLAVSVALNYFNYSETRDLRLRLSESYEISDSQDLLISDLFTRVNELKNLGPRIDCLAYRHDLLSAAYRSRSQISAFIRTGALDGCNDSQENKELLWTMSEQ